MGGLRAGAETQPASSLPASGKQAERAARPGIRSRWTALAAYLLAGLVLFVVYLRLSQTYPLNSDSANILLMASDLLHGHLLLHGWFMSDVSFYTTELPQYALLEAVLGVHMATAHVAAAMTYTLTFLLAVLLARSGVTGRPALARTLIAAGIMLAPQFGTGVFALDLSVGHVGTSVPLLLVWLLLDKAPPRLWVPVLTAFLLAWVLVADPIVYVVAIGPLGLVCALRVLRGVIKGSGELMYRIADQWYDLSLGGAAVAATAMAWVFNKLLSEAGGYTVNRLPFYLTPRHDLHTNLSAIWKVLEIFGANPAGLRGVWLALAFLHLASVVVVLWVLARVAWRFFRVSLVDQVLAVAIVLNVALYLLTNASNEAAHEVAIIVPFSAVLAARVLVHAVKVHAVKVHAVEVQTVEVQAVEVQTVEVQTVKQAAAPGVDQAAAASGRTRWLKLAGVAAGIAVLAGYTAGLGYELGQPSVPPANTSLAPWLLDHHLTYGLSGYWTSSSVTVNSGGRVEIRALMQYSMKRDLWMSNTTWYDPARHYANFIVLDSVPGFMNHWEPRALIKKYFGQPARTYQIGRYTVMVWDRNLLPSIPR
jgi:hypothetical protein